MEPFLGITVSLIHYFASYAFHFDNNDDVYLRHSSLENTYFYWYLMASSNIMIEHEKSHGTRALSEVC